ncbi:MAG: type II toxin-antitoxin system HipA family toxin [Prolixibacteraceae bacterium]|jgi:serine/threonine-protein kinase HipA|nr:type II toxin-antitoxin system HipA family toxin [Prolixibacteraceae bacterium]
MVNYVNVKLWGEFVGIVLWDDDKQIATFEYDQKFILKGWDLAPIKMPTRGGQRIFSFPDLTRIATFSGLPGLLADALPDKYGNTLIDRWLAQQGRPTGSMNPVEKLCFIGTRGMGALEFEPSEFPTTKYTYKVEIDNLVNIAQNMLNQKDGFQTNIAKDEEKAMNEILKIGTSAGGARPKAIIAYNKKTGEIKSGQTKAPKGFEHYLIKLDGVSDTQFGETEGYGRVEMAYYEMAKACEIDMMPCELLEENGRAHFLTKRFDRDGGSTKHHIQTWCAMEHFGYNNVGMYSYEQLFQTMRVLRLSYPQAEQMFKRMVFNVIARNCDDHTKNFAFRLQQGERWGLTPAYDICHAYRPDSIWVSQQSMSVNGKRIAIKKEDLLTVAKSMNIKKAERIISHIDATVSKWNHFAEKQKVRADLRDAINSTLITYK